MRRFRILVFGKFYFFLFEEKISIVYLFYVYIGICIFLCYNWIWIIFDIVILICLFIKFIFRKIY